MLQQVLKFKKYKQITTPMQRNKSMAIMAQIFNKFSNKSFVSRTCETHPTFLPIYICQKCFPSNWNTYCEQCFRDHVCEDKTKGEIGRWVSEQQQKLGKLVNTFLREYDSCNKQWFVAGRVKIPGKFQQKYISDINSEIVVAISRKLEKIQKSIQQDCIKASIESKIKPRVENLISTLRLQLNGLTGNLMQIQKLVNNFEIKSKQIQIQIVNQSHQIADSCEKLYKESVEESISEIVHKTIQMSKQKQQANQTTLQIDQKVANTKIENLQHEMSLKNKCIQNLTQKIEQLSKQLQTNQQNIKKQIEQKKTYICNQEQRINQLQKKNKEMQQKIQTYAQMAVSIDSKDTKIKKLQEKSSMYEQRLAQIARNNVNDYQKPESRYSMEDLGNKLTDLSQQYEHLVIQCNGKDKKIAELVFQLNKMQLRNKAQREQRGNNSSGKKSIKQ